MVALLVLYRSADNKGVTDLIWSRQIYVVAGLEAIVFTAVGWLFGREVNRKQAESAEKAEVKANAATANAASATAQGEALRQAILTNPMIAGRVEIFETGSGDALEALRRQAEITLFE